jgi:hypothetical protein
MSAAQISSTYFFHQMLCKQGDQILRNSPIESFFTAGSFFITEVAQMFFHGKSYASILTQKGWATFWAIFYQLIRSPCSQASFSAFMRCIR